jgi:flagellar basal body rod protein FlgG
MIDDMARIASVSHNLANVSSPGFKREIVIDRAFDQYLRHSRSSPAAMNLGEPEVQIDHKAGSLRFTGNAMDLAIEDDSFFEMMGEVGPLYTRQGNFQIDPRGRLTDFSGHPVLGSAGEIVLTTSQPRIDSEGRIFEGEKLVAQLQTVRFENPSSLVKAGPGVYQAVNESESAKSTVRLRQGYLENSNVVPVNEMIKIIETMRHFESNQKVIQSYDDMLERAIRTLGEF